MAILRCSSDPFTEYREIDEIVQQQQPTKRSLRKRMSFQNSVVVNRRETENEFRGDGYLQDPENEFRGDGSNNG